MARAYWLLGDLEASRTLVVTARETLREVDWPRFVPHLAYAAATLAAHAGDDETVMALLEGARAHPALECIVATDVEALYERVAGRPCPTSGRVDDAALLDLVDQVLSNG